MGAYNIVDAAKLVSGQPEDVAPILANFQAIQAILNGNLDDVNIRQMSAAKLANYPADVLKVLKGDGTWSAPYAAVPKITVGTFAAGPPAAPADGDIWVAKDVDATGVRWTFQYNAGSANADKWEFIGGGELQGFAATGAVANTRPQIGVTGYYETGASLVLVRGGIYAMAFSAQLGGNGGIAGNWIAALYDGLAALYSQGQAFQGGAVNPTVAAPYTSPNTRITAGDTVKLAVLPVQAGTNILFDSRIAIHPVRVS
jgi:hypothetical protein